ncbi:MAG: FKBP-type peptidyl-prolyl cis-trans isomerase [Coriobacteriales bacterium]|jgi:trigger factor|nr:FKBP-type peptidyl-prolyl cis-trans isomerase [Coriobacteriales bacterium]
MKIKRSETSDGKIELKVTASAERVSEAIRFADFQLAMQNGIGPQDHEKLNAAVREKVGDAYYNSFIDFQVMQFLAPFAVTQEKLGIIGLPQVTTSGVTVVPGKELSFTAVVTPKPVYEIDDFSPVKIQIPRVKVEEAEIDQQLVQLAENYVTYEKEDDRPIRDNDNLTFSIKAVDGKGDEIKALTAERRAYTLGQGFLPREFDAGILGMEVGETKTFDVTSEDFRRSDLENPEKTETLTFTVTVLEIQKRVIPAITDAWVKKNIPGTSTVPELREEIRKQGLIRREQELENMKSFLAASEFAKRFKGSIPDDLYELTRDDILRNLQQNLQAQGKTMQEFISEQAGGDQQFSMQLMLQTREVLIQGFSLDALIRHLKLEIDDDDVRETFRLMAPGHEREAQMEFELTGRMYQIQEGALRNKANKWLVANAEIEYVG